MKFKLPKALLASLIMCGLANANGLYVQQDTITVNSGDKLQLTEISETATEAYNTLIKDDYTYNTNDANPGAIVKAGTGELRCDAASTFYCFDQFLFYVFLSHMIYHPKLKWGDVEVVSLISGTFLIGCFLGL